MLGPGHSNLSGGMIVHQQPSHQQQQIIQIGANPTNPRVVSSNNSTIRISNNGGNQYTTTTDAGGSGYTWQNISSVTPQNYDQMYYTSEIFSTSPNNTDGAHLKTATIIEPSQQIISSSNIHMKALSTSTSGGTVHHTPISDINSAPSNHQITASTGHMIDGNTIILSGAGNIGTFQPGQIINASTVSSANNSNNLVHHIPSVMNQAMPSISTSNSNIGTPLPNTNNTTTSPYGAKKKKRPVKSKKKQVLSEAEADASVDTSMFVDDLVYIRVSRIKSIGK